MRDIDQIYGVAKQEYRELQAELDEIDRLLKEDGYQDDVLQHERTGLVLGLQAVETILNEMEADTIEIEDDGEPVHVSVGTQLQAEITEYEYRVTEVRDDEVVVERSDEDFLFDSGPTVVPRDELIEDIADGRITVQH
jgi:hypothetical protein